MRWLCDVLFVQCHTSTLDISQRIVHSIFRLRQQYLSISIKKLCVLTPTVQAPCPISSLYFDQWSVFLYYMCRLYTCLHSNDAIYHYLSTSWVRTILRCISASSTLSKGNVEWQREFTVLSYLKVFSELGSSWSNEFLCRWPPLLLSVYFYVLS